MNSKCEALLPCPFCGGEAKTYTDYSSSPYAANEMGLGQPAGAIHSTRYDVRCGSCYSQASGVSEQVAVERWNRRTPVPTPRAQMDGARTARVVDTGVLLDLADQWRDEFRNGHGHAAAFKLASDTLYGIVESLSTPVVPDETGSDKARTAGHAEEPGLDLSAEYLDGLWRALGHQQQCDEDGVMCEVSRQAVDEARTVLA